MEDGILRVSFDVRYVNADSEKMLEHIRGVLDAAGFDMEIIRNSPGFKVPLDDPYLKALLDTFSVCTGNPEPEPQLNAGGTYARCLPKALAVGTSHGGKAILPMPAGHGGVHQPDEMLDIDAHINGIAILAQMILKIDEMI